MKSKAYLDPNLIYSRILNALEAKNAPDAARKLGISKQAVYEWRENAPGLDNLFKIAETSNTSLHWLLTGQGDQFLTTENSVSIEDVIDSRIRKIFQEEMSQLTSLARVLPVQELGTVDEFDIDAAVKKYDNAVPVLRDWYAHDNLPFPKGLEQLAFSGWGNLSHERKVREVKRVRKNIEEDQNFEQSRISQKPKHPKKI